MVLGIPIILLLKPTWWLLIILMIPMIVDGFLQLLTTYESKNWKRLITGTLFGVGFTGVIWKYLAWIFQLGQTFATKYLINFL